MIKIIAAVGKNYELGKDNDLIWHIPEDLKYFKETTMGQTVVMGRKTYESIGKPLPNRENIVITSREIEGVTTLQSPEDILDMDRDVFIIGGNSIYSYFVPYADEIYLTEIDAESNADVFFPKFDKSKYKKIILREGNNEELKYSFVIYKKEEL